MTPPRPRAAALAAILAAAAALGAAAAPAVAQSRGGAAAKPFRDVRAGLPASAGRAPGAATRAARSRLRGDVEVDPLTGTPRVLDRGGAPLSPRATGDPAAIAMRYVQDHLTLLGLSESDLASFKLESRTPGAGGVTSVRFSQSADGIPAFDNGLDVVVARDGSVLQVKGSPQHAFSVDTVPALSAADAVGQLVDDLGGPGQAQATPGETPELVAFGEGDSARLGWKLSAHGPGNGWYAAVVDADTGRILYRANRTKMDDSASVWEQFPLAGATSGGDPHTVSLTPYLDAGATDLSGPFAHVWSDLNDDFFNIQTGTPTDPATDPDLGEAIGRNGSSTFAYAFTPFNQTGAGCPCSWNHNTSNSWSTNRLQNGVQTFYFVNRYRDHLAAAPISFSSADGDFQGADRVLVNTDDGASTGSGRTDTLHRNNAYMATPPNGQSPIMAMFLFRQSGFRDINGGDDADVVYHEYTHGLSGRLVTNGSGDQALNSEQAGSMGEGWSDWYAKDFLVNQFPADDTAADGDVDMGRYTDSTPHSIRSQGLDCPVGSASASCPGTLSVNQGGYTYGDFNTLDIDPSTGEHEVHEGGEIWGETLWDLRTAVGSSVAERIITEGMRSFTPPEPSFLGARNGIIAADKSVFGAGAHTAAIWQVFARRGMGTQAQAGVHPAPTPDTPVENFNRPPSVSFTASPSPAQPGQNVAFNASATTDPDGTVASYDFDFGDGSTVHTTSPTATHAYASNGTYTAIVTATDNVGAGENAIRTVTVSTATPTPTPTPTPTVTATPTATPTPPGPESKPPVISLSRRGTRGRIRFSVRCDSACRGTARITLSKAIARKLGIGGSRTVVLRSFRLTAAGTKHFTLTLSKTVTRAMKSSRVTRLRPVLKVTARDAESQRATRSNVPSIRR